MVSFCFGGIVKYALIPVANTKMDSLNHLISEKIKIKLHEMCFRGLLAQGQENGVHNCSFLGRSFTACLHRIEQN